MRVARSVPDRWLRAALLCGAVLLAWHPALWLARTWLEPELRVRRRARRGGGGRARRAEPVQPRLGPPRPRGAVAACLAATALVRLGSEALGVNVLGAAALALDVGALAAWAGLAERRRAVSPFWLAVLFAIALPVERIFQRTVGFPLQSASAAGACGLLSLGDAAVVCEGVRLLVNGREALVDLPCSGATAWWSCSRCSPRAPWRGPPEQNIGGESAGRTPPDG